MGQISINLTDKDKLELKKEAKKQKKILIRTLVVNVF